MMLIKIVWGPLGYMNYQTIQENIFEILMYNMWNVPRLLS